MNIAILGATSHIAKNLIMGFRGPGQLSLFARSIERVLSFLKQENLGEYIGEVKELDYFEAEHSKYDAIINCIGFGTPDKIRTQGAEIFFVTERYDNMAIKYLESHHSTVYINFSSGALHGVDIFAPVDESSEFRISLGSLSVKDAYRITKLNSETKHRSMSDYSIIDLRIFSFFSRYIALGSSYLASEIVRALQANNEFVTNDTEIVRDYVHPKDLCSLVDICKGAIGLNKSFDVYSRKAAGKSEIIAAFQQQFGLRVRIDNEISGGSPTGNKNYYASINRDAEKMLGYFPRYTSIEALMDETSALISGA